MGITAAQLFVLIGADITDLEAKLKKASGGFQGFADGMMSSGAKMTALVSLPLVALGTSAIKATADFETNMNVLQATSGATGAELEDLRKRAIDLGKDLTLPATSSADAAEAMLELSKSGLSVKNVMASARGVLEMSAAGALSNAQAAEIASNALNAFGLAGTETTRIADLLAASANASSAEIKDVADSLQMSAAVAASAGIPIEDLVAMIGEMANAGIKGSDAGTSLKQMLLSLEAPTDKAKNLMTELGISVYDASGKMLPARDIIGRFQASLSGLTQEQRNTALATIFGSDAVRAANIVLMGGVDAFDKMKVAVTEEGAAADLAGARMKGLGGAFQKLQSAAETAMQAGVTPFTNDLTNMVDGLANAVNSFSDLDESQRKQIVTLALVAAGTGPALTGLGALAKVTGNVIGITTQLPGVVKDAAASYQLLKGGMSAVEVAALSTGGLVLTMGALAVAVGSVVAVWWQWNEQITKTNLKGVDDTTKAWAGFFQEQKIEGASLEETTKKFASRYKSSMEAINANPVVGVFVDQSKIAAGALKEFSQAAASGSKDYGSYVDSMVLAGNATGTLNDLFRERDAAWRENGDVLAYLQQELGLLTEAEYMAANAVVASGDAERAHWVIVDEATRRRMAGVAATREKMAVDAQASAQQAVEAAKVKAVFSEIATAQEELATAQKNWGQGVGQDVVGQLQNLYLGSDKYLQSLQATDEVMGTNFGMQELQKRAVKDVMDQYARTGDIEAFKKGLQNIKTEFMNLDEPVQAAYNKLQKLKDQINSFSYVSINITASVNGTLNSNTGWSWGGKVEKSGPTPYWDSILGRMVYPPGGANGLDMIVPSGYPNDTFPVLASSGEHVVITPADEIGGGSGGGITIFANIYNNMDIEELAYRVYQYGQERR